jgi:hypothetical protein
MREFIVIINNMKKYLMVFLLTLVILFSGCFGNEAEAGLLQGNVLITPTSSVEQSDTGSTLSCGFYDIRKILIYDESGEELLFTVDIDCNANEQYARYQIELEPGVYRVDINSIGIDYSDDVPKTVEVISGTTTILDIIIDTGIRWY